MKNSKNLFSKQFLKVKINAKHSILRIKLILLMLVMHHQSLNQLISIRMFIINKSRISIIIDCILVNLEGIIFIMIISL